MINRYLTIRSKENPDQFIRIGYDYNVYNEIMSNHGIDIEEELKKLNWDEEMKE